MKDSGARWDSRYRYFTYGSVNNWGWSACDGSWGLDYLKQCDSYGFMPVVGYYVMNGLSNHDESSSSRRRRARRRWRSTSRSGRS